MWKFDEKTLTFSKEGFEENVTIGEVLNRLNSLEKICTGLFATIDEFEGACLERLGLRRDKATLNDILQAINNLLDNVSIYTGIEKEKINSSDEQESEV